VRAVPQPGAASGASTTEFEMSARHAQLLPLAPAMGRYALSLPYIAADGLRYADLTPGLFEEGAPCTGL